MKSTEVVTEVVSLEKVSKLVSIRNNELAQRDNGNLAVAIDRAQRLHGGESGAAAYMFTAASLWTSVDDEGMGDSAIHSNLSNRDVGAWSRVA